MALISRLRSAEISSILQQCNLCNRSMSRRFLQRRMFYMTTAQNKVSETDRNRKYNVPVAEDLQTKDNVIMTDIGDTPVSNTGVYFSCPDIADRVAKFLTSDPNVKDSFFFEVNPGVGLLTRALLREGITRLKLLEADPDFLPDLRKLRDENSDKLELVTADFFNLPKWAYVDKVTYSDLVSQLLRGVQLKDWTDLPALVVFATLPQNSELKFMRYIQLSVAKQNDLFSCGRVQLVFFVSGKEFDYMTSPRKPQGLYRMPYILYNTCFDIEFLTKEPKSSFHPYRTLKKRKSIDDDHLFLVRLIPKVDLLSKFKSPEELLEFYCFVKQHSVRRSAYVINSLERWIPDCGPRLIKEGFTIYTRFGDLSPSEYLNLFKQFASWPDYADCQFRGLLLKLDLKDADDDVVI